MSRPISGCAAVSLALAFAPVLAAAAAQEGEQQKAVPRIVQQRASGEAPPPRAVPRDAPREATPRQERAAERPSRATEGRAERPGPRVRGESRRDADPGGPEKAVPRHSRPRGDRPVTGQAIPRSQAPPIDRDRFRSYPRYSSPYRYGAFGLGYGAFGLGYFHYDPFWWTSPAYGSPSWYPPYYGYGYGSAYANGGLRLKVRPRQAEVYVDGYYLGIVNEFDGVFQRLNLDSGPHRIEVRAPGYEPLVFDVRIQPGETITYRRELRPQRP